MMSHHTWPVTRSINQLTVNSIYGDWWKNQAHMAFYREHSGQHLPHNTGLIISTRSIVSWECLVANYIECQRDIVQHWKQNARRVTIANKTRLVIKCMFSKSVRQTICIPGPVYKGDSTYQISTLETADQDRLIGLSRSSRPLWSAMASASLHGKEGKPEQGPNAPARPFKRFTPVNSNIRVIPVFT